MLEMANQVEAPATAAESAGAVVFFFLFFRHKLIQFFIVELYLSHYPTGA